MSQKSTAESATLYHGTPYAIHSSRQPFLDPRKAAIGGDLGDPQGRCVYATTELFCASLFAFRTPGTRSIHMAGNLAPLMVYDGSLPHSADLGNVYEVQSAGFKGIVRPDGQDSMWSIPESAMPLVYDSVTDAEVPGVQVGQPYCELTFGQFIVEQQVGIYSLSEGVPAEAYLRQARAAGAAGCKDEFFLQAIEQGWIQDITAIVH
jgi:hypothetical protein